MKTIFGFFAAVFTIMNANIALAATVLPGAVATQEGQALALKVFVPGGSLEAGTLVFTAADGSQLSFTFDQLRADAAGCSESSLAAAAGSDFVLCGDAATFARHAVEFAFVAPNGNEAKASSPASMTDDGTVTRAELRLY